METENRKYLNRNKSDDRERIMNGKRMNLLARNNCKNYTYRKFVKVVSVLDTI